MADKPRSIDEYLAHVKHDVVGFGATRNHCAFYLLSNSTVADHREELEGYDTSTGTIRFQPDRPLPAALVRKLVKARIRENESGG